MIVALALHLILGPASKVSVLQGLPDEARPVAASVFETFEALAAKETMGLPSVGTFRRQVARAGGNRFPTIEWNLDDDTYLLDPDLRLRFWIDGIDAARTGESLQVVVRFQRFLDRRDSAGVFGTPGRVLTEAESLRDTYELKRSGGRWQIAGYRRDAKSPSGAKP